MNNQIPTPPASGEHSNISENTGGQKESLGSAKGKISEVLDSVSKATVAGLVVIYACGFVTISISNAEYGFIEVNPLRPKILGAGALFAFLMMLPLMVAHGFFPRDEVSDNWQRYARNVISATSYFLQCNTLAVGMLLIYAASGATTKRRPWWEIVFAMVLFASAYQFKDWGGKAYKTNPKKVVLIGSALTVAFFIWLYIAQSNFIVQIELWLFFVGSFIAIDRWVFWKSGGRPLSEWSTYNLANAGLLMIPILFYFSRVVYPLILPSWGGGSPIRVVVYFSHDSRILPNQQFEADLIDESDNGLYVVKRGEKQAIFVPRQAISALFFADKPLAPEFLKDGTSPTTPQDSKKP